ncbi:MAG: DNRLRE domain-containing protein [Archangiaceae bacterium]|nr:DNRLRE domain-containing protein [Archangiaceae bacterium]
MVGGGRVTLLLVLAARVAAAADAVVSFQDGVSPTAAYAGTRDTVIYSQKALCWDPNQTCDRSQLLFDGSPALEASLVRWDLSQLPTTATLTSASLDVNVRDTSVAVFKGYESLRPWVETEASWVQYAAGAPWAGDGGSDPTDHGPQLFTLALPTSGNARITFDAVTLAVLQRWVSTPAQNHGFFIAEYGTLDGLALASSEDTVLTRRPRLNLTYDPGGVAISFQNGVLPTAAYAGCTDVTIGNGPDPDRQNYNVAQNQLWGTVDPYGVLLSFDTRAVPPWASVVQARLRVYVSNAGDGTYPAYGLLRPWVETQASWGRADTNTPWQVPGADGPADHRPEPVLFLSSPAVGSRDLDFTDAGVQLAQEWVANPSTNYGVVLSSYTPFFNVVTAFQRRESAPASQRPELTLTYAEGQLGFLSVPAVVPNGVASGVMTVRRETLGGAPITTAPALSVTVSTSSATAELALDAAGPFSSTLVLSLAANAAETAPFVLRDVTAGTVTLTATPSLPAWRVGQASTVIGTVPLDLSPRSTQVQVLGFQQFVASGGAGGYRWALESNLSGGTLDSSGGYTAGAVDGVTDVVTLHDSTDAGLSASVTVTARPVPDAGPPDGGVDAGSDGGAPDGGAPDGGAPDGGSDGGGTDERPPPRYGVGCQCGATDGSGAVMMLLALAAARARRRRGCQQPRGDERRGTLLSLETNLPAPSPQDVDLELLEYLQTLTPYERLVLHQRASETSEAVRKAGAKFYGEPEPRPSPPSR